MAYPVFIITDFLKKYMGDSESVRFNRDFFGRYEADICGTELGKLVMFGFISLLSLGTLPRPTIQGPLRFSFFFMLH